MHERVGKKLQDAVELTKMRLKKANPEYEKYFSVLNTLKIESIPYYGYSDKSGIIVLSVKYIDLNSISTVSRLIIHEFLHYYIWQTTHTQGHGAEFNRLMHEVYVANGLKTRENYTSSSGNMMEINAVCPHCGQEYHWSQARLARYKAGAKFYCHECYDKEHKYYWLKSVDDIAAGQVK